METDRGETTFLLDSEDDVRRLGDYKALFIDTHGIRYLIPDTRAWITPAGGFSSATSNRTFNFSARKQLREQMEHF